ncbi:restriction endonuclease subunit S [Enterococcus lactis]|uniref:restriction endonuclease subunit S n=1 Tax=Enterococcus lactis TaxID=357441 RepID=UPI003D6C1071
MSNDTQPEIRFPGFTEDWEQRKLSELATMNARIGWQNLRTSEFLDKGDYMLITGTDFKDGAIDYSNIHYVERERFEQDKKIQISNGSILITKDGTLGKVAYVEGLTMPATLNAGVFNVRVKENLAIDSRYLFHYLKAPFLLKFADQRSTGGTIKHLNQNVLVEFPIPLPSLEEQHKVAGLLSNFDNTIALHQRKLDLLKETKKGFLQKMFPKNGAKVPEIRFPGFTEDWEQRKFKEFSKKTGKKNTKDLDFPAYSVSNKAGLISQTEQFDGSRLDDLEKTNYKFVEPNEFAYNPARVNVGSIAFNNLGMTVIVSSLYVVVKMSEDLDNEFILQFIKSPTFIKEVKRNTEGSVREYLFYENFANIKFPFTRNKEEQQKIGAFFKQLDDTIALHQRKLDLLKETKKGFLQKMFV